MFFLLVTLNFLMVNIDARPTKSENPLISQAIMDSFNNQRPITKDLYEAFFELVNSKLVWDEDIARLAAKVLKKKKQGRHYQKVLMEREIGYPLFYTGEEALLTLETLWVREDDLEKVKGFCEGTKYGCNYEHTWRSPTEVFMEVLCLFKVEKQ